MKAPEPTHDEVLAWLMAQWENPEHGGRRAGAVAAVAHFWPAVDDLKSLVRLRCRVRVWLRRAGIGPRMVSGPLNVAVQANLAAERQAEDERLRELHGQGLSNKRIAAELGWRLSATTFRLNLLGLVAHPQRRKLRRPHEEWAPPAEHVDQRLLAKRKAVRDCRRKKRDAELEALGNPTHCGCCGLLIEPQSDGADGRCIDHRHDNDFVRGVLCVPCNRRVSLADLRYDDPELWRATLAWSARGEPVAPTGRKRADRRRMKPAEPTLFGGKS